MNPFVRITPYPNSTSSELEDIASAMPATTGSAPLLKTCSEVDEPYWRRNLRTRVQLDP
jgi:hypothetical protein